MLLIRSTAENYANMTEKITPLSRTLDDPSIVGQWSMNTTGGLVALSGEIHRQAAMIGYINAFYLFTLAAALAIPLAWMLRDVPKS